MVGVLEWMLEWVGILKMEWVLEKVGMEIGAGYGVDKLEDKVICKTKAEQLRVLDGDGAVILRPTRRSRAADVNTLLFSSPALER